MHIYPTESITQLSPFPWGYHLIDFARRSTFSFSLLEFSIAFYAARALCSQMDFIMCRALSRYFIVSGKGQFIVWEEGGEALSGRTSNEHAWFFFLCLSLLFLLFRSCRQTLSLLITKQEGKINVCCHVCPAKATTTTGRWLGRVEERGDGE